MRKSSEWECRTISTNYAFGPFRLDAQGETLFRDAKPIALSQRAVALLRILVDRAGAPVSKDALMEAAWPGLAVEDSNLTVQIAALRRALGEVPGGEGWIVTLPRRGYRFVGPVVTKGETGVPTTPTAEPATKPSSTMAPALPDKPSIAVLPFENLSGEAFAFGPFRLIPARRELLAHGVPVTLGQRAFDVLLALVNRHGDLLTKDELMSAVWPGAVVQENSLQVQVKALRKVLGAVGDGKRYLVTVTGRGYRFVAPVERAEGGEPGRGRKPAADNRPTCGPPPDRASNLPNPLTSLIGRETDLADITDRLATHRLITLTGSGGVGKSRLAIEAGYKALDEYADGVWLAELAPLHDPQLVASIIADAAGVSLDAPQTAIETLARTFAGKHLLLIIDNCEHVIAEVARVAEVLLRRCGRLSILASSRERLAIPGEYVIRVPSLPVPEAGAAVTVASARGCAAVQLFADRARALGEKFELTDRNAEWVSAICRRLDGIPLAIELAVPRLRVMSVQQLEHALDERFQLLTGGNRTALLRQQTLHALIDWSYGLLTNPERTLLARLSVFLGSSTLASVVAVVAGVDVPQANVADLLLSLVEKSLVHAEPSNKTRYRLLESTRLYARGKLGLAPALFKRHAEHFVTRFAEATTSWETTPTQAWLELYAADVDNLRGALQWAFALDGDNALGIELVGRSHVIWAELGLLLEHRRWVHEALASVSSQTPEVVMARLLSWQAGDVRELDDPADVDEAMQAAAIYGKLGDAFQQGRVLLRAGMAQLSPDRVGEATRILLNAHALLRPSGASKTLARCLSALASARLFAGDTKEARSLHCQAMGVYCELGERSDEPAHGGAPSRTPW